MFNSALELDFADRWDPEYLSTGVELYTLNSVIEDDAAENGSDPTDHVLYTPPAEINYQDIDPEAKPSERAKAFTYALFAALKTGDTGALPPFWQQFLAKIAPEGVTSDVQVNSILGGNRSVVPQVRLADLLKQMHVLQERDRIYTEKPEGIETEYRPSWIIEEVDFENGFLVCRFESGVPQAKESFAATENGSVQIPFDAIMSAEGNLPEWRTDAGVLFERLDVLKEQGGYAVSEITRDVRERLRGPIRDFSLDDHTVRWPKAPHTPAIRRTMASIADEKARGRRTYVMQGYEGDLKRAKAREERWIKRFEEDSQ